MPPLTVSLSLPEEHKLSDFLRLSQEAAFRHLTELGLAGLAERQGLAWVIIRIRAELPAPPSKTLTVTTWPGKEKAGMMPRYCEMYNPDGSCAARLVTTWVLADSATRQMRMDAPLSVPDMSRGDEPPVPRALPRRELPLLGNYIPAAGQIDSNGHVNNAAYLDLATAFVPEDPEGRRVTAFAVDYRAEILPGTKVSVCGEMREDTFLLSGKSDGREHFRMTLTYG